jgi:hypothetical protein
MVVHDGILDHGVKPGELGLPANFDALPFVMVTQCPSESFFSDYRRLCTVY